MSITKLNLNIDAYSRQHIPTGASNAFTEKYDEYINPEYSYLNFINQLASVELLGTINIQDYQTLLYPYFLSDASAKLPEFISLGNTGDFFTLKREFFALGILPTDMLNCCLTDTKYKLVDGALYTCNPLSKNFVTADYCDSVMLNYCQNNLNNNKCIDWLKNAMNRIEPIISLQMNDYCINNLFTNECEVYINALRHLNLNVIADNILSNVWTNTKDLRLTCSFGNINENKVIQPKVCWNYNCINSPNYLLLQKDIIAKSLCSLYSCNIILNNVLKNKDSNINIDCSTSINNNNSLLAIALKNKRKNILSFISILVLPFILLLS